MSTVAVNVPLLDLKAQHATIKDEIAAAINEVVESQHFIMGPVIQALEKDIAAYCGAKHAIGCASGSDALMLALMALGIGPGDEVICPAYTFFATGGSIARLGAKPIYADIEPVTYNMDPVHARALARKCTRLKAIMPVHLYGQAADMDEYLALGEEFGVPVIEDAAQAIGTIDAGGALAGSRGTIGCFSFFPSKNLGGFGDGGIMTTNDDRLADLLGILRVHGGKPKYYHKVIGINSRLDALQAAVLRVKLRRLDQWHEDRRANAAFYDAAFAKAGAKTTASTLADCDLPLLTPHPAEAPARHIYNQYVIRVPAAQRDPLRDHLTKSGVGTEIYYPVPLHLQECFAYLGGAKGDLPESEAAANETIALPIYPELTKLQLQHVVNSVVTFLGARSAARVPAGTTGAREIHAADIVKVLHVNDYAEGGGAEIVMQRTIALLRERGCAVETFTSADIPGWRRTAGSYIDSRRARAALRSRLERFAPDIVHLHNFYHELSPGILAELACVKRSRSLRVVMTAHDHHLLCPSSGLTHVVGDEAQPVDPSRLTSFKFLATTNWDHRGWGHSTLKLAQHVWNYRWLHRERVLDAVICPNRWLHCLLAARGLPAIFLAHPAPPQAPSVARGSRADRLRLICAGRVEPEKGLRQFIEHLPADFIGRLVVVGDGSELAACREACHRRGMADLVEFTGRLRHEEALARIAAAHVLVMPSLCHESYGLGLIEALSQGTNVLVSDVPALREIVEDSGVGFLYQPRTHGSLAEAIARITSAHQVRKLNAFDAAAFLAARSESAYADRVLALYRGESR